jgi:hypothetical protein
MRHFLPAGYILAFGVGRARNAPSTPAYPKRSETASVGQRGLWGAMATVMRKRGWSGSLATVKVAEKAPANER